MKVLSVVGARPNFIKIASFAEALGRHHIPHVLVHTGQHYDRKMSDLFFQELAISQPDINLEVGSGSHALQTAEILRRFEPVMDSERPDLVVVVGDVNSTLAASLVAAKKGVPVAHIEAGLRSFDRTMPEEINRMLTDALSDLLFASEPSGVENLRREGVDPEKIHFVGNVMIDTLLRHRRRAQRLPTVRDLALMTDGHVIPYVVVTLHRPSNVDTVQPLRGLLEALAELANRLPVVFPVHPRTRAQITAHRLGSLLNQIRVIEPMGYLEFLSLLDRAALVITDSGGIQEETTVLGVLCLTVRDNTERPATVQFGTNQVVGHKPERLLAAAHRILDGVRPKGRVPELWDGQAAERIVQVLLAWEASRKNNARASAQTARLI